ncbi:hypothetical protein ES703_54432 [subsurface metagenome]
MEKLDNIDDFDLDSETCPFNHTLVCPFSGTLFDKSLKLCYCCQVAQLIREVRLIGARQQ